MNYAVIDREEIPMLFIPNVKQTVFAEKSRQKEYALYIHIPFCKRKCHFCSIPVLTFKDETAIDSYLDKLIDEIKMNMNNLKGCVLKAVHIGGGTPSLLSVPQIKRLLDVIIGQFGDGLPEIVFEANPESLTQDKIDILAGYQNVTLNIGIQTFNSHRLREINLMEDVNHIKRCLRYALGKKNLDVGIDLIVGLPNSTLSDVKYDLEAVNEFGMKNIFIYPYRSEKKSFFFDYHKGVNYLSQDELIKIMEYVENEMYKGGFIAKSMYYWTRENKPLYLYSAHQIDGGEWIGVGAGAYSYLNFSVSRNSSIIEEDCSNATGCNKMRCELVRQNITSQLIWDLTFMIKKNDFDAERIKEKYGKIAEQYLHEILEKLEENGYSQQKNNKIRLSAKGKVLLDRVESLIQEVVLR